VAGNDGALAVEREVVDGPERCSLFAFRTCLVERVNRLENALDCPYGSERVDLVPDVDHKVAA
jgi:hypothetical protein